MQQNKLDTAQRNKLHISQHNKRDIDKAMANNITMAVCSTSNDRVVRAIVRNLLGKEREHGFAGIYAGDMVPRKKPDPAVYNLAARELELNPAECVVIEDSRNGMLAAVAEGMNCLVTLASYTVDEDFSEADKVVRDLGDNPGVVNLSDLNEIVRRRLLK